MRHSGPFTETATNAVADPERVFRERLELASRTQKGSALAFAGRLLRLYGDHARIELRNEPVGGFGLDRIDTLLERAGVLRAVQTEMLI